MIWQLKATTTTRWQVTGKKEKNSRKKRVKICKRNKGRKPRK
jgi:hypothetical protein